MSNLSATVVCFSYNHERFIGQAIQSFLDQRTNFPVRFVVHDDASTDGTQEVIRRMADDRFTLLLRTTNLLQNGVSPFSILNDIQSPYIAICEGDDYWTHPGKLQAQVELLERNPGMAFCHTLTDVIGGQLPPPKYRRETTIKDLLQTNYISTASVVFRRRCMPVLDAGFVKLVVADWPLWYLLAQNGTIGFVDFPASAYRIHAGNNFAGLDYDRRIALTLPSIHYMASKSPPARAAALLRTARKLRRRSLARRVLQFLGR